MVLISPLWAMSRNGWALSRRCVCWWKSAGEHGEAGGKGWVLQVQVELVQHLAMVRAL